MRTLIAAAMLAAGALVSAPAAHADTLAPFIDYLDRNGLHVATQESSDAEVQLGQAICQMYGVAARTGRNPNQDLMLTLERQHSPDEAAAWLVGSINYVCPQWLPMLP